MVKSTVKGGKFMSGTSKSGLLEQIAEEVGCLYLSSLREVRLYPKIRKAVKRLEESEYSQHEWEDAVSYITGNSRKFSTSVEAKQALLQYLNQ